MAGRLVALLLCALSALSLIRADCSGGAFGVWSVDPWVGLPRFDYTLNELTDPRGTWTTNSQGLHRTDHFHVFGNDRVNVMAVDHGYVQLYGKAYSCSCLCFDQC
jgi:hypothetical protein